MLVVPVRLLLVEGIFYQGQIFDAYKFATDLIRSAKQSLVLIDNYVDESVLLMLSKRGSGVTATIDEMSQLFARDISVIGKHIRNIFKEGELSKESVWAKFAYTASDGKTYQVDYYNLDVIISVGYRVKSHRGTQFRQWANKVLKEYLLKGYSVNQRLMGMEQRIDRKLQEHEQRLNRIDSKIDFFVRTSLPPVEGIFFLQFLSFFRIFSESLFIFASENNDCITIKRKDYEEGIILVSVCIRVANHVVGE